MAERELAGPVGRPTGSGPGRVLIAVYAVFAVAATGRSVTQLIFYTDRDRAPYLLSALAAAIYIAATVGLARRGAVARRLAWSACGVELVGVLTVGTLSLVRESWFPDDTVWSGYGQGYGWFPLALPVAGLAWLVVTRPPSPRDTARR